MNRAKDIILYLRKKHNLTQKQLAEKAKITNVAISNIESGKTIPLPETLDKIANVFGMGTMELLQCELTDLDNTEISTLSDEEKKIKRWAQDPSNFDYIKFAYNIAINKEVPISMLNKLELKLK